jgi:hypothetical protein
MRQLTLFLVRSGQRLIWRWVGIAVCLREDGTDAGDDGSGPWLSATSIPAPAIRWTA